ncbi:hypothetical protein [Methylobacterium nonmethylotrophicum]|uniref:hypothetical protein n=1 Tax=Methylobacterium nonmethylotrophicum TaxID=1141884 RepID=UPI00143679B0|nr:hypothetical protein [Methylobacterium nonmethylotrophicum]
MMLGLEMRSGAGRRRARIRTIASRDPMDRLPCAVATEPPGSRALGGASPPVVEGTAP